MGKASSSKKIARAARAGGRASGVRQRNLLFPGTIAAIVVLGLALVGFSIREHKNDANTIPPLAPHDGVQGDHWHAAYGVWICDEWVPAIPTFDSTAGIHTHGDGVIHIHPFAEAGAGENATIGTFLKEAPEVKLSNDKLEIGGKTYETGKTKCGDKKGELVVARWEKVQSTDKNPALLYKGFDDIRFREDGEGYTIAFVPEDEKDIPKPESAAQLSELGSVDSENPTGTTTTVPGETTTTVAGETTTTAPAETTTTAGSG
jgi:hypothetical protein